MDFTVWLLLYRNWLFESVRGIWLYPYLNRTFHTWDVQGSSFVNGTSAYVVCTSKIDWSNVLNLSVFCLKLYLSTPQRLTSEGQLISGFRVHSASTSEEITSQWPEFVIQKPSWKENKPYSSCYIYMNLSEQVGTKKLVGSVKCSFALDILVVEQERLWLKRWSGKCQ